MEKIRIRDPGDPGSGMEKVGSGIRKNIPDPQHCPCHRVLDGRGFLRVHSGTEVLGGHQIGQEGNSVAYFSMG